LIAVLLTRDAQSRRYALAELLASDPALLLWTVSLCDARGGTPLDTFEKCAAWLSEQDLARLLAGCELCCEGLQRDSYERLLAASLAGGRESLPSILANASEWMELGGLAAKSARNGVPNWLARAVLAAHDAPLANDRSLAAAQELLARDAHAAEQLTALVAQLARLAELESHFADALQQAKLDAMKEMAYGAGHELNNPLANISTRAQVLLREESDPERRRKLAAINAQAFRGHEMIADLMLFARPPRMSPELLDLDALLARVIVEAQPLAAERRIDLVRVGSRAVVSLAADENQLMVALTAMVKNAVEVLGIGGRIEVELKAASDVANGECAIVQIRDNGPGIEPHVLPHIFDPFFSGREAGRGLGFGLSKAWRIITNHGGTILVDSQAGRGATFTVRLPLASRSQATAREAVASEQ
jgi:signal transduction histidine kinase